MSEDREMSDKSYDGEEHFDKYDHYNYDQDKAMMSGHSGELEITSVSMIIIVWQVNSAQRRRPR